MPFHDYRYSLVYPPFFFFNRSINKQKDDIMSDVEDPIDNADCFDNSSGVFDDGNKDRKGSAEDDHEHDGDSLKDDTREWDDDTKGNNSRKLGNCLFELITHAMTPNRNTSTAQSSSSTMYYSEIHSRLVVVLLAIMQVSGRKPMDGDHVYSW
jgi:hypothetical protein